MSSTHLLFSCCYISNRSFSDFISFSLKEKKWYPCPFSARNKLTWIKIKVWNMKKTSILPRASACLSKAIWNLLHLCTLGAKSSKINFGKPVFIRKALSSSLHVLFLQLCIAVSEMCHHFPKISLYCPASPVLVSISSLCSARPLPSRATCDREAEVVSRPVEVVLGASKDVRLLGQI